MDVPLMSSAYTSDSFDEQFDVAAATGLKITARSLKLLRHSPVKLRTSASGNNHALAT